MAALSVQQLTKTYANGLTALKNVDLEVQEGDFFALLGQNGAGKSTFIGIVSSLINKTQGKVSIYGYDLDTHCAQAKALIGVVPQEINFSMFDNIYLTLLYQAGYYGIPIREAKKKADKYLQAMGLWDKRNQPAVRLSGGMKRRLMIARAMMGDPKLLILDEPTAGVDIELRHTLWRFLEEINQEGTTIILTTHYLEEAEQLCKNIAIIDHGEIIENATTKSLINRLNRHTIILDFEETLFEAPPIDNFHTRFIDSNTIELDICRGQSLNDAFAALSKHGLKVLSMRNKTNRLEELFINLISKNHEQS